MDRLTQYNHHGFQEGHHGVSVASWSRAVPRHPHGPLAYVDKDVGVQRHHDNKRHKVKHSPEHQVGIAIKRRHVGASLETAYAVPANAGDGPHDDGHGPYDDDHHHHAAVAHACVELHAEHGDVALDGDGQQVGHGRRQAGVDQALAKEPGGDGQATCVGPRVEHQVEVGQAGEEVSSCQVGHQVVDGEVEPPVDVDGDHHQEVCEHDEDAHGDAQTHHQLADSVPVLSEGLAAAVVEEGDGFIVVALFIIHGGSGVFWKEKD